MKKRILITDTLFIFDSHIERLKTAGFEVIRLPKFKASESELIEAIKGINGYILGGIENVTTAVIEAADSLEAICFTGSGFSEYIPAHNEATKKGIAITAAKGANAIDVAEFTIGMMLEMARNFPLIRSRNSAKSNTFYTGRRMRGMTVGVVGYGRIGSAVAKLSQAMGMRVLVYSRSPLPETIDGITKVDKSELLANSDIITVHVDKIHGKNVLDSADLSQMKHGSILINAAFPEAVDNIALLECIKAKKIRAAFDAAAHGGFDECEIGSYNFSNGPSAYNTTEALVDTSDRCTDSIINVLNGGNDADIVNPDFKKYRSV